MCSFRRAWYSWFASIASVTTILESIVCTIARRLKPAQADTSDCESVGVSKLNLRYNICPTGVATEFNDYTGGWSGRESGLVQGTPNTPASTTLNHRRVERLSQLISRRTCNGALSSTEPRFLIGASHARIGLPMEGPTFNPVTQAGSLPV